MSELFEPFSIGEVIYKNRLVLSPMCMYSAIHQDGHATDWHLTHYTSRAIGGFGLLIQEATAVSPEGRISPEDLGIWSEEHIHSLKPIVEAAHNYGAKMGIQLAHAGRKASATSIWKGSKFITENEGGWSVVGPTAIPFNELAQIPTVLSTEGIQKVIQDFKSAAARATACGYDVIEIHAAHGYLIHEFLSPITNLREDEYGGDFAGRTRLLLEIVQAVRSEMNKNQNLFVRLSCVDYLDGGWTIQDSIQLAKLLKEADVDVIDCSSGAIAPGEQITAGPLYQVPFSQAIKKEANIKTAAVGLIEAADQAQHIIANGQADLICIGRPALRDPYLPNTFYRALNETGHLLPPQYLRAFRK